ncbi:MAG: Lrp/AsnC family transcriptional regulator [Candidatus Micrarchaeota archaeon]|nr:Lrp/AsnC family transcriptional regulator [Candidatus Micrarchaeota archaeon]
MKTVKLDRLDVRLLQALDMNSRRSESALARELRTNKSVVNFRIKRLAEGGILRYFYTMVDVMKLGYFGIRVYLKIRGATPGIESRIVRALVKCKNAWWVARIEGEYSVGVVFWVKDVGEFNSFWRDFSARYKRHFRGIALSLYNSMYDFGGFPGGGEKKIYRLVKSESVKVTKNELEVLRRISGDARAPTVKIAESLGLSPLTVAKCIKSLLKKGVIMGFRVMVDTKALGLTLYKANFTLTDLSQYKRMVSFASSHPNVAYIDETTGFADFEVEALFSSHEEFEQFIDEFKKRFSGYIADYSYFAHTRVEKIKHIE